MKNLGLKGWIVGLFLIAITLSGCGSSGEGSVKNDIESDSSGNSDGGGGSSGNSDGGEGSSNPAPTEPPTSSEDLGFKKVMIDGGGITEQQIDGNGHLVDVPVEDAGEATTVAVYSDSNGTTVHITYLSASDGALKHAWCASENDCSFLDSWQKEIIDQGSGPQGLGRDGNMAIDQNHQIHVSYRDYGIAQISIAANQSAIDQLQSDSNKILKYATNASGRWQSVIVDDTTDAVTYTQIKVDGNERIHISYKAKNQTFVDSVHGIQSDNALYYATCSQNCLRPASTGTKSPAWTRVRVDGGWEPGNNNYAEPNSTFITNDAIHISYYANETLKYATCPLTTPDSCKTVQEWSLGVVDDIGNVGRENSLAVNSDGVHITYRSLNPEGNVKYAFCATGKDCTQKGNWTTITVDSNPGTGKCTQIRIDGQNRLHVIYGDSRNGDLKYAFCVGGCIDPSQWSLYLIDAPGTIGGDGYLALESDGPDQTVHVSYRDGGNYALKYAFGPTPIPD
ncbi:hypothetical protein [Candidatus Manganitrophus noduliformans]|uniref:Uncharacterized protein n=1 Tax=Candidatus Manganitrophus noduliformans TaxID=2606439 RepID=A0A7X6DUS8_9BACT|nr:hypothetical protein [Candidatus Manganitrophus noduliformans]NKE73790.1 hypothetical protein [Candidatus Manganitrophus noduliformans]